MMKNTFALLLIAVLIGNRGLAQTVTVDEGNTFQTIEGFGGFGAKKVWWEQGPWHDAGYLSETVDNLGVTIFRTQIYWDGELSNDNDDPNVINPAGFNFGPESDNGKQFPFIRDLHAKGAKLIATVWTPPVWMKLLDIPERVPDECYNCRTCPVGSAGRAMCGGRLNPEYYEEFAEYLVAYVKTLKEQTDVDLYAISIQNEPYFANPFESNVVMPEEYADLLKVVGTRFEAEGLPTKFFGPEHMAEWSWGVQKRYVDETLGDPEVKSLLDIYAVHGYVDGVAADYGSAEGWTALRENISVAHDKPLWMTETSDFNLQGFNLAMSMSKSLYLALKFGNISAWVYWSMNDAMVIDNKLTPLGYAFKNYYRFVRPGAVRIGSESTDAGILTVAFRHPDTNDVSIVLINQTSEVKSVTLNIPFEHGDLIMYRTSDGQNCANLGVINRNQISLPANSINTLSTIVDGGIVDVQKKSEYKIKVYPNPAGRNVLVELPEGVGPSTLKVIDSKGKLVLNDRIDASRFDVDTRTWPGGTYIFQISAPRETTMHRVVIP